MPPRMPPTMRSAGRFIGLASLLMAFVSASPRTEVPDRSPPGESPAARINPEVRLRKLHLVRPDLIPYPLAYEVYC